MISDSDMDAIYNAMGVAVTFASPVITGKRGIFTDATDDISSYGVEIEAQKPTLMIRTSQITGVKARQSTVTVNATAYTVEKVEKLGTGESVLYLKN